MSDSYEDIYLTNKSGQVWCSICKCNLSYNHSCIELHITGNAHSSNYVEKLKKKHNIRTYSDQVRCNICDVYVSTNEDLRSIQNHISMFSHKNNYKQLFELCCGEMTLPDGISGGLVRCNFCSCDVPFKANDMRLHLFGHPHCFERQARNAIFDNDEEETALCKICNETFPYFHDEVFAHIKGATHTELLQELKNIISGQDININDFLSVRGQHKAYCQKCKCYVPCTAQNLEDHVNGYAHDRNSKKKVAVNQSQK